MDAAKHRRGHHETLTNGARRHRRSGDWGLCFFSGFLHSSRSAELFPEAALNQIDDTPD